MTYTHQSLSIVKLSRRQAIDRYEDAVMVTGKGDYWAMSLCGSGAEIVRRSLVEEATTVFRVWNSSGCSRHVCRGHHFLCVAAAGWDGPSDEELKQRKAKQRAQWRARRREQAARAVDTYHVDPVYLRSTAALTRLATMYDAAGMKPVASAPHSGSPARF